MFVPLLPELERSTGGEVAATRGEAGGARTSKEKPWPNGALEDGDARGSGPRGRGRAGAKGDLKKRGPKALKLRRKGSGRNALGDHRRENPKALRPEGGRRAGAQVNPTRGARRARLSEERPWLNGVGDPRRGGLGLAVRRSGSLQGAERLQQTIRHHRTEGTTKGPT